MPNPRGPWSSQSLPFSAPSLLVTQVVPPFCSFAAEQSPLPIQTPNKKHSTTHTVLTTLPPELSSERLVCHQLHLVRYGLPVKAVTQQ